MYFTGDLNGIWESLPLFDPATVRGGNQLMPYMNNLCGGVFIVDLPAGALSALGAVRLLQPDPLVPRPLGAATAVGIRCRRARKPIASSSGCVIELIPYIYTYSRVAHDTGLPLVRGMYLEYPDQEAAYASDQQYLFGRDLLVAADYQARKRQAGESEVFLPAGDDWFDFFTGDLL